MSDNIASGTDLLLELELVGHYFLALPEYSIITLVYSFSL